MKNTFIQGAIPASLIAQVIEKHQTQHNIGAHDLFLGQVRADEIDGKAVVAIDYTAYEEMAIKAFEEISKSTLDRYNLESIEIYHSLGPVKAGALCLFVFIASQRRREAMQALTYAVEEIKAKSPIFGKEIFEDDTHQWKINS